MPHPIALAGAAVLFAGFLPSQALAQSPDDEALEPAKGPAEEAAEAAEAGDPGFSRVIDREETIYAVQRKAYLIEGTLELSVLYSTLVGDRFVTTDNSVAVAAGATYHLSEAFALEVFGGWFRPTESETTTELAEELATPLETEAAKLTQLLWAAGVGVQWSPIYGKLQVAGTSLGNFAFFLGVGAALGESRTRCRPGALDPAEFGEGQTCPPVEAVEGVRSPISYEPNRLQVMGVLSGGVRFRFLPWLALRAEVRDYIFTSRIYVPPEAAGEGRVFSDSIRNNIYLQIGLSFLLGSES